MREAIHNPTNDKTTTLFIVPYYIPVGVGRSSREKLDAAIQRVEILA
jgi:hypothetical protein